MLCNFDLLSPSPWQPEWLSEDSCRWSFHKFKEAIKAARGFHCCSVSFLVSVEKRNMWETSAAGNYDSFRKRRRPHWPLVNVLTSGLWHFGNMYIHICAKSGPLKKKWTLRAIEEHRNSLNRRLHHLHCYYFYYFAFHTSWYLDSSQPSWSHPPDLFKDAKRG